jgi:hypothetical protein
VEGTPGTPGDAAAAVVMQAECTVEAEEDEYDLETTV